MQDKTPNSLMKTCWAYFSKFHSKSRRAPLASLPDQENEHLKPPEAKTARSTKTKYTSPPDSWLSQHTQKYVFIKVGNPPGHSIYYKIILLTQVNRSDAKLNHVYYDIPLLKF